MCDPLKRNPYGFVISAAFVGTVLWVVYLLLCLAGVMK